jgi:hypothetical protein
MVDSAFDALALRSSAGFLSSEGRSSFLKTGNILFKCNYPLHLCFR